VLVGRTGEPAGDVVELVDRGANSAESREALVGLARSDRDLSGRDSRAAFKFRLDELRELVSDVNASDERRPAECSPGLGLDGHAR
jgi:hypothetical protein